jgi:hypothetical protein
MPILSQKPRSTPKISRRNNLKSIHRKQGPAPAPMAGFRGSVVATRTHWLPNIFLTGAKRRIFIFIFV